MKKTLTFVLFLSACGPSDMHCITGLGVNIVSMANGDEITESGYSCEDFNTVEREYMSLLPSSEAMRLDWNRVRGYNVKLHSGGRFITWWGQKVSGFTVCAFKEIEIGVFPPHVARSSYGHELLHAAQDGWAVQPIDKGEDADHANWTRDGFRATMNTVASWH